MEPVLRDWNDNCVAAILGRVLLGLFRNRNTRNSRYWSLLVAIPFSEWTEYHSVHSAPNSRMNGMNGISFRSFCSRQQNERNERNTQFTRNRQNTRSFGKFLAGNPTRPQTFLGLILRPPPPVRQGYSVFRRSVLFEIEIPCIMLSLNRNNNSQNSSKRMHPWWTTTKGENKPFVRAPRNTAELPGIV